VAAEERVPLIDLHGASLAYLNTLSETLGLALGLTKRDALGATV
jgi:hypothetical protein